MEENMNYIATPAGVPAKPDHDSIERVKSGIPLTSRFVDGTERFVWGPDGPIYFKHRESHIFRHTVEIRDWNESVTVPKGVRITRWGRGDERTKSQWRLDFSVSIEESIAIAEWMKKYSAAASFAVAEQEKMKNIYREALGV
jgi:hypothetical protein